MSVIDQKEYLKRYLSADTESEKKQKKKQKKVAKAIGDRVKIIDDDIFATNSLDPTKDELFALNEDAPQIVGFVDERPLELRIDDYRKSGLWKPLGENSDEDKGNEKGKDRQRSSKNRGYDDSRPSKSRDFDESPPRRRKIDDMSPLRKQRRDDESPPRKISSSKHKRDERRIQKKESDWSPPRKRSNSDETPSVIKIEDESPPRRKKDEDMSPQRKSRYEDPSPPRRRRNEHMSPPRRRKDHSPPRKRRNDQSPPRRNKNNPTPVRRSKFEDSTPPRRNASSPKGKKEERKRGSKKSRWGSPSPEPVQRPTKTLDGKTAGLQSAKDLIKETLESHQREESVFRNMSAEVSGVNASTIIRDRKTGKIRNLEEEAEEQRKKQKVEDENNAKYSKWGKGLKQVEDQNTKLAEDLHEMTKPLARYADDEDLERLLKEQEREGDPMLAYIRKKKKRKAVEAGKPLKPQYEGEFMPNRFGIRPGYRWDGVDRSGGYEKEWFTVQNSKKAEQEEVYRWNTEDM